MRHAKYFNPGDRVRHLKTGEGGEVVIAIGDAVRVKWDSGYTSNARRHEITMISRASVGSSYCRYCKGPHQYRHGRLGAAAKTKPYRRK